MAVCAYLENQRDFARGSMQRFFSICSRTLGTISQGEWDERKTFEYLYATGTEEGVFGCLARFRQGFFVYGFTVDDPAVLPEEIKAGGFTARKRIPEDAQADYERSDGLDKSWADAFNSTGSTAQTIGRRRMPAEVKRASELPALGFELLLSARRGSLSQHRHRARVLDKAQRATEVVRARSQSSTTRSGLSAAAAR